MCALPNQKSQNIDCTKQPLIGCWALINRGNTVMAAVRDDDDQDVTVVECLLGLYAPVIVLPGAWDDDLDLTRVWQVTRV